MRSCDRCGDHVVSQAGKKTTHVFFVLGKLEGMEFIVIEEYVLICCLRRRSRQVWETIIAPVEQLNSLFPNDIHCIPHHSLLFRINIFWLCLNLFKNRARCRVKINLLRYLHYHSPHHNGNSRLYSWYIPLSP